ncbi:MAG: glycosyltransferase family 2 protein, partial [Gemmatimonadota bacterium]
MIGALEGPWWTGLAAVTAAFWLVTAFRVIRGMAGVGFLRDEPPVSPGDAPRVSVCVAARNEEDKVARGVRSMAELDYPGLEVVAVDDRSEDATGRVLEELAGEYDCLRVLHVGELPRGWLGKNHALQRAVDAADGEVLLFTDAVVVFRPDALSRAVGCLLREDLDHLTAAPDLRMPGPLLEAFAGCFQVLFTRFAEPWRARDPESDRHVGIGAFNLVRRDVYRAAGGHRAIRRRPDDDMRLARALRQSGARADIRYGTGILEVPWYGSLREAVRGLSRSAWPGLDYSLSAAAGAAAVTLAVDVWPWIGWVATAGPARWLNLAAALLSALLFVGATRYSSTRAWLAVLWPVTGTLFVWILL